MAWLFWVGGLVVAAFSLVVLRGAPYLPTKRRQVATTLELLKLKPGQTLIDLGSGDGTVLLAAAKQGIKGIGYELNPVLCAIAWLRLWRYRRLVTIRLGDFWLSRLPECDGVFVFLIEHRMAQLRRKLETELTRPTMLASYTFELPGYQPVAERDGVRLYKVAPVASQGNSQVR
jgi:hypothetical protein